MTLADKRILITGASGGLGTATMRALQSQRAHVVGIDKVPSRPDVAPIIVADLRDAGVVRAAVDEAIGRLSGLDILINNAGVLSLQDPGTLPGDDVLEAIDVNLLGPWRVTAAALPALLKSHGRVINIASLFAVVNAPFIPAYCATKRALSAYSDVLRCQYGDRISVTTIYPGYMDTPIHEGAVRQGLSVAKVVTFRLGGRTVATFEEPIAAAARRVVRACAGAAPRDTGMTLRGKLTYILAHHAPALTDRVVAWRLGRLMRAGMRIELDSAASHERSRIA